MRALVVYESMFGNTEGIAKVVAGALRAGGTCAELVEVHAAPRVLGCQYGLLVVGAPTHAFGLPRQQTRQDVTRRAGLAIADADFGIREWLGDLTMCSHQPAATFETRSERSPGSAARAAARRLRDRGAEIMSTASFTVVGAQGPLAAGEEERAEAWAAGLVVDAAIHRVG